MDDKKCDSPKEEIRVDISKVFGNDNCITNNFTTSMNNNENNDEENEDEGNQGFFHKLYQKPKQNNDTAIGINQSKNKKNNDSLSNKLMLNKKRKREPNKSYKSGNKKQICQFYINGACNKGDKCPYSHQADQIHKRELCKFFLSGHCNKKDACLYSHNLSEYPCKFFHARGFCENFDKCRFSHERLSDEAIFPFIQENEHFLFEIREKYGVTNMDDFLNYYLKEKNALPDNAMIPDCIKDNHPLIPNDTMGQKQFMYPAFQLSHKEMPKMNQMIELKMRASSNKSNTIDDKKTIANHQKTLPESNRVNKDIKNNQQDNNANNTKVNQKGSSNQKSPPLLVINPFKHPKENEEETLQNILSFIKGTDENNKLK